MFCGKCGNEIDGNTQFCGKCGAALGTEEHAHAQAAWQSDQPSIPNPEPMPDIAVAVAAPTAAVSAPAAYPASSAPLEGQQPNGSSRNRRIAIIVSIVAIAVIAICGIYAFFQHKAYEESHMPVTVSLGFSFASAEGAGASSDAMPIGVPMGIKGIDLDGKTVDERFLATPSGERRELLQGSYEISVIGNPITTGGIVYACDGEDAALAVSLAIDSDSQQASSMTTDSFAFAALPVTDVTDEMLSDIRSWMEEYGVSTAEVDAAIKAATDKREAELARIAAEEERARQEAEAARLEQERQAALAANPTYTISASQTVQLTGVVKTTYAKSDISGDSGSVCYLELPQKITLDGMQYGASDNKVILSPSFAQYAGKTITISTRCTAIIKPSVKESSVAIIQANSTTIVRVW